MTKINETKPDFQVIVPDKEKANVALTVDQEVSNMVSEYLKYDSEGRVAFFTKTAYENAMLKRRVKKLEQDLKEMQFTMNMIETAPLAWKTIVKTYFSDFAGFDNGACSAIGKYIKAFKEYVTDKYGDTYFAEKGRYKHMYNFVMQRLEEKSNAVWIKSARKNYALWTDFSRRMEEFCRVIFSREWLAYGMVEKERIKNNDGKRHQLRLILDVDEETAAERRRRAEEAEKHSALIRTVKMDEIH